MARKGLSGRHILSAGEIGAYTVCPEAWRLQALEKVKVASSKGVEEGRELHKKWATNYERSIALAYQAKLVIFLLFVTILLVIVLKMS